MEDAAYPSSPPPPNSGPEAKKPRIIIIAVRKSGRVRMHKARENVNGTFSIGKTWPLDDLTAVESFNGATPRNSEEEQRKQWAGGTGFIVSIGKPYYWQANTQKEKQFFIASLVKIFTKYTGGKSPELIGFDEKETEQLLGITSQARQLPANNQNLTPVQAPLTPNSPQSQAQPRGARRTPISQDPPSLRQQTQTSSGATQSATPQATRSPAQPKMEDSPSSSVDYSGVSPQQSQSSLRRVAAGNYSQESFSRGDDTNGPRPHSRSGANGMPFGSGRFPDRSMTPTSRTMTPENASNINDASSTIHPIPEPLALPPERRRPPIQVSDTALLRGQDSGDNMVPAPLISPGIRRADIRPPVRSNERPQSPTVERVSEASNFTANRIAGKQSKPELRQSADSPSETRKGISKEDLSTTPSAAAVHSAIVSNPIDSPNSPTQVKEESPVITPDGERPGLGPMIKKKKSKVEVANTFRKAASAANAFKPRAGGAAERLREQQAKQPEGPDGITSVVPAPSLVRNINSDSTKSTTPNSVKDTTAAAKSNEGIPEVKVTGVQSRPTSVETPTEGRLDDVSAEKGKGRETRRQKPTSEVLQKELESLGVDSSILDSRATEFASFLDEFGWVGEGVRTRNIDQMKEDIEREINTAQAGGWLSRLEEEDERIEAIQRGIEFCIAECDELDGLLTLYSVELGVSVRTLPVGLDR
jgi:exocyst complex component 1